jgi:hypothetical protein
MEQPHVISQLDQQQILQDLLVSDAFEHYLATKFPKNKVRNDGSCVRRKALHYMAIRMSSAEGIEVRCDANCSELEAEACSE